VEEGCRVNAFSFQHQGSKKNTQEEGFQTLQEDRSQGPATEKIEEMDATE
jgi:hypothetical protein